MNNKTKNMARIILLFGLLTMLNGIITAQGQVNDTLKKQLKEVVITASKSLQSIGNVTQQVDVVKAGAIQLMPLGNRNVCEAIQQLPGASISALSRNDANWGTYGGIGAKYSTYMLGGLPIDAYLDPMALDLGAFDRIEVQRGPASVLYANYLSQDFAGSQSPLAGTVNLILRDIIDNPLTRISLSYGSYNTLNGQIYNQGNIKNLGYFVGASYEMSDYTDYGIENSWLNMHKNPEYKKLKVFGGGTWHPFGNEGQKVTLFVSKTFHNGDAGRIYRGYDNDYATINAGYSADFLNRFTVKMNMGLRQYSRQSQESNYGAIDTLKSNNGVEQIIVPVDISLTVKHYKGSAFIIGADYQGATYLTWSDPLTGYKSYGNKSAAFQTGVYAQEEFRISGLTLRAGLRFSYIKNNIELVSSGAPGESSKDWKCLIWSGGAKYNIGKIASVFANAGNSFITPGLKSTGGTILLSDLGVPGKNGQLPNPDLKPESGIGIDAGFNLYLPLSFYISVRGFDLMVNDAILENVVSQSPSQTQSVNAGKSSSVGVEAEVKHSFTKIADWYVNYTFMKTSIKNPYDADQDGNEISFAPSNIINAGINLSFPFGLKFNPYLNYTDGYYDSSSKTGRKKFTPGLLLNANISQIIVKKGNFNLECFARIYNLTNNKYDLPWQFRNTGFSVMGGLTAQF